MGLNVEVLELTANEYVFLTLAAGQTLQAGDKVIMQRDMAERTLKELGSRVTLSSEFKLEFEDGDVTPAADTIGEVAHGMENGQAVELSTTGALPAPLQPYRVYYVVEKADDTFKLSETVGGAAVDITAAAGGGTHTLRKLNPKLKHATFEIVRA
jgi:hypothetical protein